MKKAILILITISSFVYGCGDKKGNSQRENQSGEKISNESEGNVSPSDSITQAIENANKEIKESTKKLEESLEDL